MEKKRTSQLFKAILILGAWLSLVLPTGTLAYNWPWDQGHDCVKGEGGISGWGRWGYDGVMHGEYTTKECCELLCKICPVYANTGALQKTFTDLSLPGVGPALRIVRTYNSQDWATTLLGRRWTFNFGRELVIIRNKAGEKIIGVLLETGEKNFFRENIDGSLERLTAYGVTYELIKNSDGTYTIKNRDGSHHELRTDGKISKIIDKNNNELVFEYNSVGCLSKITNASGNYVSFQLGPNGRIASISDNLGRTIAYNYDENSNLISFTDPMGNSTQYIYDSRAFLSQIIDPRGNVVESATYDNNQPPRVATFTEKGETYTISYFSGYTRKRDSSGNTWTYYFNDVGVITKVIDPLGNIKEQSPNKITSTTLDWEEDLNGNRTTYAWDANGNMISKTDPLGNTTTYTYITGTNWVETETNSLGVITKYEYNANGNRTKLTRDFEAPLQNTTAYTYDSKGNRTSVTGPMGHMTRYEFDLNGNLIKVINPLGNVTAYTDDSRGNKITETNPNGATTAFTYDLLNRQISVTDSIGNSTLHHYDSNSNLISTTDAAGGIISYEYDSYNRLIKTTDPLGGSFLFSYDNRGNIISVKDPNGNITRYEYNILNRLTRVTDFLGNSKNYTFDAVGNLISFNDARGNIFSFQYNAANRPVFSMTPDGNGISYTYNSVNLLASKTDPNGNTIIFIYDRLNRLIRKVFPDGSSSDFTYDLNDRILTERNSDNILTYVYDALGNVIETKSDEQTIHYSYDAAGNRVRLDTPEGKMIAYLYNQENSIRQMTLPNGDNISYAYNSLGKRVRVDYSGGNNTSYQYNSGHVLTEILHSRKDGGSLFQQSIIRDKGGNIIFQNTGTGIYQYSYDSIYQITGVSHASQPQESFSYDAAGNRLTSNLTNNWAYNNTNQLLTYNGVNLTYDRNGNVIEKIENNEVTDYFYDYENRLQRINLPDGTVISYKYDVRNRRIEKNVAGNITRYLYDGYRLLAEYDESGKHLRSYFYGGGDLNPAVLMENDISYFYLSDHLNVARKIVDREGLDLWEASYNVFGQAEVTKENLINNFRFPGQYWDNETKLHYNIHRYYAPELGRYMQMDSIGIRDGSNHLYNYARNNPLRFFDFLGLEAGDLCSNIIFNRKNIHPFGEDKYGHWWVEMGGESYGWWPKYPVGLWGTLTGVEGELNGQISFGGSPTRDPHHGDSAEETFNPKIKSTNSCKCNKCEDAIECIRKFAQAYSGTWSWPWGQSCHSFQTSMMNQCCLEK